MSTKSRILIHIGVLTTAVSSALCATMSPYDQIQQGQEKRDTSVVFEFARPPALTPALRTRLLKNLSTARTETAKHYRSKDWKRHARSTLGLLRYSQRVPIFYLVEDHDQLLADIRKYGTEPFLSYVLDYGLRVGFSRDEKDRAKFKSLVAAYRGHKRKATTPATVLLRSCPRNRFRAHSEYSGQLVALLLFSRSGEQLAKARIKPNEMLRVAALHRSCQESNERRGQAQVSAVSSQQMSTCALFGQRLRERLGETDFQDFNGLLGAIGTHGIRASQGDCISSLKETQVDQKVQQFEDYYSCRQSTTRQQDGRSKVMQGSDYDFWTKPHSDVFPNSNSLGGDYTRTTNDNGDEIDKGQWGYADGSWKTTEINYTTGEWSEVTTNKHGNVTQAEFGNKTGEQGSYSATYNDNQTLKQETIVQQSGNTTETTTVNYDNQGNETSRSSETAVDNGDGTETVTTDDGSYVRYKESTTLPPDEYAPNPCVEQMMGSLREDLGQQKIMDRLQPYINPNPEDVVGSFDDPCLSQLEGSSPRKCVSVYLCTEGTVDQNCRCSGSNRPAGELPAYSSVCAQMRCAEGECDPYTGACKYGSGGPAVYTPGVPPKPPEGPRKIDCNTTIVCMNTLIFENRRLSLSRSLDLGRSGRFSTQQGEFLRR